MKVIDVSDWNNNIDWSNVTYAGVVVEKQPEPLMDMVR